MDPIPSNSQRRFFAYSPIQDRVTSSGKAKVAPINEMDHTRSFKQADHMGQHIPSVNAPKEPWCNWKKALIIVCILHVIILVVACIVIPIYLVRLVAAGSSTSTTASTTVYLPAQCSNYTLDTDSSRLTTYSVVVSSGCDVSLYSTPLWVRFGGVATRMATSAPQIYRCATSAPGWYTGTLPSTAGTTVTGVVCFSWTSTICDFHSTVSVTNCNGFYVYLLVSPSQCSLRYCTE